MYRTEIYCRADLEETARRIVQALKGMVNYFNAEATELRCSGYRHWVVRHSLAGFGAELSRTHGIDGLYVDCKPPDLVASEGDGSRLSPPGQVPD